MFAYLMLIPGEKKDANDFFNILLNGSGYSNKYLSVDFLKEKSKNIIQFELVDSSGISRYVYSNVSLNKLKDDIISLI